MPDSAPVTPDAKALEGTTIVDATVAIEAEILAYRALRRLARSICEAISTEETKECRIVVHNDADMTALSAYRTLTGQLTELRAAYDAIAIPAAAAEVVTTVVAATTALKAFIDLIALFRKDVQATGVAIAIDDLALVSEVGGQLAASGRKVYLAQLFPPAGNVRALEGDLDATRKSAVAARARAAAVSDPTEKARAEERSKQLDAILQGYENLFTTVAAGDANAVAILVRGAGIADILEKQNANVLHLKLLKAGGRNETTRSLFGFGRRLTHSGGVVASYIFFDDDGTILKAGTAEAYSGRVDAADFLAS